MKCKYCKKAALKKEDMYYCGECDIYFLEADLDVDNSPIELIQDPYFADYVTTKELLDMTVIELTHLLGLARRHKRTIKERMFANKKSVDIIDQASLNKTEIMIVKLENILIQKQGYVPAKVYQSTITKELSSINEKRRKLL